MARDGEIPAIFNPKRVRTPSVVVTGDSPNGPFEPTFRNSSTPQIIHSDSVASSQHLDGGESGPPSFMHQTSAGSAGGGSLGGGIIAGTPTLNSAAESSHRSSARPPKYKACKDSCCSELAQKMYFGVCVTILVTASWVGATHCIKFLYLRRGTYTTSTMSSPSNAMPTSSTTNLIADNGSSSSNLTLIHTRVGGNGGLSNIVNGATTESAVTTIFNAPFFASWFCTNFAIFFFPIYILGRTAVRKCESPGEILTDVLRGFRDRGLTVGRFINRCMTFCVLWLLTTYLYALSLRALLATNVMALFSTNVACVYLLSWVILHEQFVGVRIVAVILCDTGIALLAYMDGITGTPTLGGVVLAALAAAGYAVFKVMFRKVMGDPPIGQIAFTFTTLGFLNAAILWPICIALYFSGAEVMPWEKLPWAILLIASILMLVFHILTQLSSAVTYNMFVTLGLITSVPVSAALDVVLYGANFAGMKLAGLILIAVGFFLVMFPDNWPDYITRLLRNTGRAILRYQCCCDYAEIDYENSKYHLVGSQREVGSSPARRYSWGPASRCHRLSDGLHSITSSFSIRPGEMTTNTPTHIYNTTATATTIDQQLQQQQTFNYNQQQPTISSSSNNLNNIINLQTFNYSNNNNNLTTGSAITTTTMATPTIITSLDNTSHVTGSSYININNNNQFVGSNINDLIIETNFIRKGSKRKHRDSYGSIN